MIREVDVIFFVEHKDRELESIKLIAKELKKQGKSSLILSIYFHVHLLYKYKAKIFVFPYLININDWPANIVYKMYGCNVEYINLNWEQLISKGNEEYKKPQDNFVKNKVKQIAWSEHFKKYLIRYGVNKKNIKITGNPSNEILYKLLDKQNEWRENLSEEFNLDKTKKWLFMPMNYGWAFISDKSVYKKIKDGYPSKIAWEYRNYSKKCLQKFILFIEEVSKKYDYEIIIRPHPSIAEDDYKNIFNEIIGYIPRNIYLNKKYSIREWIVSSDIVGSSWSTSVWDAYNVGKPVFLFTPIERPLSVYVWWNDLVANLNNYSEKKLSKKEISYTNQNPIYNIALFCKNDSIDNNIKIQKYVFDIKNNLKIIRCFFLDKKFIKINSLEYDRFEKILYEK